MRIDNKICRKRIRFYGEVQAVGFRYQAMRAAKLCGTTGWVRNEFDGTVTMEVQGTRRQIGDTVAQLDHDPYIRIERTESEWLEPELSETGFRVRY